MLANGSLNGNANTTPDVGCRLLLSAMVSESPQNYKYDKTYVETSLRLPEANVLRRQSNDIPVAVNDTRTRTPSAHVDANVMVLVDLNLISSI